MLQFQNNKLEVSFCFFFSVLEFLTKKTNIICVEFKHFKYKYFLLIIKNDNVLFLGLIQAGCHGSGSKIPTIDESVLSFTIVTPSKGTLTLSANDKDKELNDLFYMTRVGLGLFGVVFELTLKVIPAYRIVEVNIYFLLFFLFLITIYNYV